MLACLLLNPLNHLIDVRLTGKGCLCGIVIPCVLLMGGGYSLGDGIRTLFKLSYHAQQPE